MTKDAVLQIRMESDVKRRAEEAFSARGTTLAEAVRAFVEASTSAEPMSFEATLRASKLPKRAHAKARSAAGILACATTREQREAEKTAWSEAMRGKHGNRP